jgi:hypothetical protein
VARRRAQRPGAAGLPGRARLRRRDASPGAAAAPRCEPTPPTVTACVQDVRFTGVSRARRGQSAARSGQSAGRDGRRGGTLRARTGPAAGASAVARNVDRVWCPTGGVWGRRRGISGSSHECGRFAGLARHSARLFGHSASGRRRRSTTGSGQSAGGRKTAPQTTAGRDDPATIRRGFQRGSVHNRASTERAPLLPGTDSRAIMDTCSKRPAGPPRQISARSPSTCFRPHHWPQHRRNSHTSRPGAAPCPRRRVPLSSATVRSCWPSCWPGWNRWHTWRPSSPRRRSPTCRGRWRWRRWTGWGRCWRRWTAPGSPCSVWSTPGVPGRWTGPGPRRRGCRGWTGPPRPPRAGRCAPRGRCGTGSRRPRTRCWPGGSRWGTRGCWPGCACAPAP